MFKWLPVANSDTAHAQKPNTIWLGTHHKEHTHSLEGGENKQGNNQRLHSYMYIMLKIIAYVYQLLHFTGNYFVVA